MITIEKITNEGKILHESNIEGTFQGFNDNALFSLSNGQCWLQSKYKYWYHYSYRPKVRIYKYGNRYYIVKIGKDKFAEVRRASGVIKATVISEFKGWKREALFELDNGQVWKQTENKNDNNSSDRHQAIIYDTGFTTKIHIDGTSVKAIRVK